MQAVRKGSEKGLYKKDKLWLTVKIMNAMMRDYICTEVGFKLDKSRMMWGWISDYLYYHKDRTVHQKEVESSFHLPKSTIATILKKMEQEGMISRVPEEKDTRLKRVMLSDKGLEEHQRVLEQFERFDKEMCEGISEEEIKIFFKVSNHIIENLEKIQKRKE